MKYILVLLSSLLITGCEPASTESSNEQNFKYNSKKALFEPFRISDNTVVIYGNSSNDQILLKRVDDIDGTCWVTVNTTSWNSSVSCVHKERK